MKLSELQARQPARLTRIDLDERVRQRLAALGLRVRAAIELIRYAPLRDPAEYLVDGSLIALRRRDAENSGRSY